LAETTSIIFMAPMFVVLLASLLLGEKVGVLGWVAVFTGFIGVVLIVRPGKDLSTAGIFFALLGAMANATYQLMSRVLISTEKTVTMLFYTALVGSIIFGIALLWFWENKTPSTLELALFLFMGCVGGLGHYFFTLAYRHASASLLAPVTYLQLLWAGLLGWLIFDTAPDGLSIVGMTIVAGSGIMIALKSRLVKS
jgi:drug/metabolite transporter (DMT)-like permease